MSNNLPTIRVRTAHLTSSEVYAEVRERYGEREISDAAAATIASWWQAPSNPALAALASGCPVTAAAICDDIARERRITAPTGIDGLALDMLCTWAINFDAEPESYPVSACVCCAMIASIGECGCDSHEHEPLGLLAPGETLAVGDEWPSFSWRSCDTCGDRLGGDRYDGVLVVSREVTA